MRLVRDAVMNDPPAPTETEFGSIRTVGRISYERIRKFLLVPD
jgi:hypothetical protein